MRLLTAVHHFRNPSLLAWNGPLVTLAGVALALGAGLLLVRLSPLGGVLFVGLAVVGVATLIEPLVGMCAALFLGPLWAYLRAEVPQVPAQIAQPFVALALAVWLAQGLARRELYLFGGRGAVRARLGRAQAREQGQALPLWGALVVFVGAALLSLWDAVELPVYGVPEFVKWLQILLLFLLVADRLTWRKLPWLLGVLLVTGLFQAAVGLWQFGLRGEGPEHFGINERFYRAYGTFEQPNPYAGYVGMMLALACGVLWGVWQEAGKRVAKYASRQGTRFWAHLVYLLPCLLTVLALGAALVASWSRGAWLGFGAASLAMAVALPRKARRGLLLVVALVVGGLGLYRAGLLPASVAARLTSFVQDVRFTDVRGVGINDANYAVLERLAHWQAALEMWRANFWTGVGFGCYEPAYPRFALINWPLALGHAHNYYLTIAAETGLIGLTAYLLLWGTVFWQTWRAIHRTQELLRGIAVGLLGVWTHLSVHHLLDNLYVNNVHLHIGVLLGLLAFIIHQTNQLTNQPTN